MIAAAISSVGSEIIKINFCIDPIRSKINIIENQRCSRMFV